tara:strand:- start:8704 stop:14421 length:5718 start_codon:yes stop_codon:yes gene_type:complete
MAITKSNKFKTRLKVKSNFSNQENIIKNQNNLTIQNQDDISISTDFSDNIYQTQYGSDNFSIILDSNIPTVEDILEEQISINDTSKDIKFNENIKYDIRYVDLVINSNKNLSILDNVKTYKYFRSNVITNQYLKDFYSRDFFKFDQEIKFLHSISYDREYEITNKISNFKELKFSIIEDISEKLNNQLLKVSAKTNFVEFLNENITKNSKLKSNLINSLQSGLNKLDSFIFEKNYPNNILNIFKSNLTQSNLIGKVLNKSLKSNRMYEETLNFKSDLKILQKEISQLNMNFSNNEQKDLIDYFERHIGSFLNEKEFPFLNSRDRMNSNSFALQLFANLGFSMYGLYPTLLLHKEKTNIDEDEFIYQDLKSDYPSIVVNFFKEYKGKSVNKDYDFNLFTRINVNSKSFDIDFFKKNDLFIYNPKKYYFTSLNLPLLNDSFISGTTLTWIEILKEKSKNYFEFLSFLFRSDKLENLKSLPNDLFTQDQDEYDELDDYDKVLYHIFNSTTYGTEEDNYINYMMDKNEISDIATQNYNNESKWRFIFQSRENYDQDYPEDIVSLNSQNDFTNIFEILDFLHENIFSISENFTLFGDIFNFKNELTTETEDYIFELVTRYTTPYARPDNPEVLDLETFDNNIEDILKDRLRETFKEDKIDYKFYLGSSISTSEVSIILPKNILSLYNDYKTLKTMSNEQKIFAFNRNDEVSNIRERFNNNDKISAIDELISALEKMFLDIFLIDSSILGVDLFSRNMYYLLVNFLSSSIKINDDIFMSFYEKFGNKTFNESITVNALKEYIINTRTESQEENFEATQNIFSKDILNVDKELTNTEFNNLSYGGSESNEENEKNVLNKFIESIKNLNDDRFGYLYYSKGFDNNLVSVNKYNYARSITDYLNSYVYHESLNDNYIFNNYNISYLTDRYVKQTKLYALEYAGLNYDLFKNLTNKLSKLRIDLHEVPTISNEIKKEQSAISENDNIFNLLIKKGENKFYSSFDFSENNDYDDFDINDSINLILKNPELIEQNESDLQNILDILSKYYYNNTINSSSQFLVSAINNIRKDLNNTRHPKYNKVLEYLYFSNFETSNTTSDFDSKNSIVIRFIKKAISRKINASENLKNSDLGYIFDLTSVDLDKLSEYNKKIISNSISEGEADENLSNNGSFYRSYTTEVNEYYENLFATNDEYRKIKNAIFNNNSSINKNYEFYYIPISTIKTPDEFNSDNSNKIINLHNVFNKFPDSHQDFLVTNNTSNESEIPDVEDLIFLFDCYTLSFPYMRYVKKNIPFKIPKQFLKSLNDLSFTNETLVKNYCTFDTNINSKQASAYINFNIKNQRKEYATLTRSLIKDNFDEIIEFEDSSFRKIINAINIMMSATTNIDDLTFEDIEDIDKFISDNKFIIGLTSNIITIYGEIFNNLFKENQLKTFIEDLSNVFGNIDTEIIDQDNIIPRESVIKIDRLNEIEIGNVNQIDLNILKDNLGFEYKEDKDCWNIKNYNLDNFSYEEEYSYGYKNILKKNIKKLTISDFSQAISFDILVGYLKSKIDFEKENQSELIINDSLQNFYQNTSLERDQVTKFFNLFYMNQTSKDLSRKFYYDKDFYANFIDNQDDSETIRSHYDQNLSSFFNLYKEKNKFVNNDNLFNNNIELKNKSILTFGITNKIVKSMKPTSFIKIQIEKQSNALEDQPIDIYYFSPLLTNVHEFFNDYISLDDHVGFYDIYTNLNKRYLIGNKESLLKVDKKNAIGYLTEIFNTEDVSVLSKVSQSLENCIKSNKINNLLNIFYNFSIETNDFYKNENLNRNTCSIDIFNIINSISSFNFKKLSNITKTKFNSSVTINNEENFVVLPGFDEVIKSKTEIFELLNNVENIQSIEEMTNCFKDKTFYDFYHVCIDKSVIENYNNIKITVSIEQ